MPRGTRRRRRVASSPARASGGRAPRRRTPTISTPFMTTFSSSPWISTSCSSTPRMRTPWKCTMRNCGVGEYDVAELGAVEVDVGEGLAPRRFDFSKRAPGSSCSRNSVMTTTLGPVPDVLLPVWISVLSMCRRDQPHRPRPAHARDPADPRRRDGRRARRAAGRHRAGRAPVRRHPPRGRHPGRLGPRPARRLPARTRDEAAPGRLHRARGAGPGHGGARRAARRGRRRRHRRLRPGQGDPGAARGRRAAGGGAARARLRRAGRVSTRPDPAITSALVSAVAAGRRVLVTYRSESGNEWEAEVDPWAVVVRHGRWYLLCLSHHADAVRTYRIDRIRDVQQTERAFERPDGLDPVAALEEYLGTGWEYPTRVVFAAPPAEVAPWIRPPMGRLEPLGRRLRARRAAPTTRRCTRRSGWPTCRSPSASKAAGAPGGGRRARRAAVCCRRQTDARPTQTAGVGPGRAPACRSDPALA